MNTIDDAALANAQKWLAMSIDNDTKEAINRMKAEDTDLFNDSFYRTLEFGTGGLRGIMGIGTNRMNKYVVAMATQGFANYVLGKGLSHKPSAVISFDSRNNSRHFAEITSRVFAANGFKVFLFEALRPTPVLSFAVRELKCDIGVMITASHNPKEYNGYKAYWSDGGQLVSPNDTNVIAEVNKITDFSQVKSQETNDNITILGKDFDDIYLRRVLSLSLSPEAVNEHHDIKIAYTPLHGTGGQIVPKSLRMFGFTNVIPVAEQLEPDGNFPTCVSPNPEEHSALTLGLKLAREIDADILLATDPDADREALAAKDHNGNWILFNGNQTASVITYYLLSKWQEKGWLNGKQYIVSTIVSSDLIKRISNSFNVKCYEVLTGFKFIADKILTLEGTAQQYIGGGEESYGYLIGDFVRDKDAVSGCCIIAEIAAWAKQKGKTIYDILIEIYQNYGFFYESLLSIVRIGKTGQEEIAAIMQRFRLSPPKTLLNQPVVRIIDYLDTATTGLPKSNVLQWFLADGTKISMRPSGTEPKVKFYFGVASTLSNAADVHNEERLAEAKINQIKQELNL
ncbi:MAG: phospho-sugar mutase [Bacteroidales bacterium]|jgi:phosphoglucomutase|nr:phospho-sugar mutase [Bacteroidales bacterium]